VVVEHPVAKQKRTSRKNRSKNRPARRGKSAEVSKSETKTRAQGESRKRGTLHIALFYARSKVRRDFQSLGQSDGVAVTAFDLTRFSHSEWDSTRRFDAVIVEQNVDVTSEPNMTRWLRKNLPDAPILAYGASVNQKRRSAYAFHLTDVPTPGGIRSLLTDARRHHETAKKAARATHRLRETYKRLQVLGDIVSTANSSLEPDRVVDVIMSEIQQLIPSEAWSILLVDEERKELTFEMALGEKGEDFGDSRLKIGEGIAGWVAKTGKPVIVNDVARDHRFQKRFDEQTRFETRSVLCAPLVSRGSIIGVVEIINRGEGSKFTRRDLKLLLTLVEPAAIALENAILFQRAEKLAVTDDLTKLYNSRYLNSYLGKEISRASRHGTSLSLIFLDLDGFKSVNDCNGHLCGSRTLYEVGTIIKTSVREEEVVGRYGGDEFVVILPDTDSSGALLAAERIRQALRGHEFLSELGLAVRLSASLGVSCFPEHGATPEDLIQKADQAMYSVKEQGKDAVGLAE
jgi:diguanylate cyclase (GGDEF)-like protein